MTPPLVLMIVIELARGLGGAVAGFAGRIIALATLGISSADKLYRVPTVSATGADGAPVEVSSFGAVVVPVLEALGRVGAAAAGGTTST